MIARSTAISGRQAVRSLLVSPGGQLFSDQELLFRATGALAAGLASICSMCQAWLRQG